MGSKKKKGSAKRTANLTKMLLEYVNGKRYKPLTYEELIAQLGISLNHTEKFKETLAHLVSNRMLVLKNDRYLVQNEASLINGVVSVHPKGFGFVKNESGPDIFIPKQRLGEAVDGDEVEVELDPNPSPKGPEGTVTAILKRNRTFLAGTIVGKSGRHYTAFSPLLGQEKLIIIKTKSASLQEGDRIVCKVIHWGSECLPIEAELTKRIGHISDPSIDVEAARIEFDLPDGFSKEVLLEAEHFGQRISAKYMKDRVDLTDLECVTIDPDTARDFDDAISLTIDNKGHYHLGVHIADVAAYVQPGSLLDIEAFHRCNSTYFPGQCIPMLPEALSNGLCSLKPGVKRLTQSVLVEFDPEGTLVRYEIVRGVIKSCKRFTYKQALVVLEKKTASSHAHLLERMVSLCHLLKRKRFERGSIDFSMAEDVVIVDDKGAPMRIERVEYDITHQMIEEFMLKANEIVAIHLQSQGKMVIYRVHEEPSSDAFNDFYQFARVLGFYLPSHPTHRDIQKLFQEAKDSPLLAQLSVSFIRSMRLASYSSDNLGHYGLALEHYCHFTSPIRRYTDLVIQRLLFNELPPDCDLDAVAQRCSEMERLSFRAESSVTLLKKLRLASTYFAEDPHRIYSAIITRIKPFALFFEVPLFDLEGSLHVSMIGKDYYEYDAKRMMFRGVRTGKTFLSGQTVYVRLDRIQCVLQRAEWSLVPPPSTSIRALPDSR